MFLKEGAWTITKKHIHKKVTKYNLKRDHAKKQTNKTKQIERFC